MREESHLDDMRAAIRGDFERLAERRGGQELMSTPLEPADPAAALEAPAKPASGPPVPEPAPASEPPAEPDPEPAPASEPPAEPAALDEPEPQPEHEEAPRRSWLARLLGR